jgi:hypothetical protein
MIYINIRSLIFILAIIEVINAQFLNYNLFQEKQIFEFSPLMENEYYKISIEEYVLIQNSNNNYGIDLNFGYKTDSTTPYNLYRDNNSFYISPFLNFQLSNNMKLKSRLSIHNIKSNLLDQNKVYWGDEFLEWRGDFEVGTIVYKDESYVVKFGRDYFMPGIQKGEHLLFSRYQMPYDQILIKYYNDFIEGSVYYLSLGKMDNDIHRHLNGHRLSINLFDKGYIALNEIILYGGENKQPELALFNPLIQYYMYQKNSKYLLSNSILTTELFLTNNNKYIYIEFLIDDFQADDEGSWDLEPMEYAFTFSFGFTFEKIEFKLNHTHVANRTYNVHDSNFEKFIYKNYPIGHFLGNNFWETSGDIIHRTRDNKNISSLSIYFRKLGEEALYSDFNTDFLDYQITDGYDEKFPFGDIHNQLGCIVRGFYSVNNWLVINYEASNWWKSYMIPNGFNFSVNLLINFNFSNFDD